MKGNPVDTLTPKVIHWPGLLFGALLVAASAWLFHRDLAVGVLVGLILGFANFKAIAFVVKRTLGPYPVHRVLYGLFGSLKFILLAAVFFVLVYYRLLDVYGLVAGFSAVLLVVLVEGLVRAGRYGISESMEEKGNA